MPGAKADDFWWRATKFLIYWTFRGAWLLLKWIFFRLFPERRQKAPSQEAIDAFYDSRKWQRLSEEAKDYYGRKCMKCKKDNVAFPHLRIVTDHIYPIRFWWQKRKRWNNLQILCDPCNKAKGSYDTTDYRGWFAGWRRRKPMIDVTPQARQIGGRKPMQIVSTYHARQREWLD